MATGPALENESGVLAHAVSDRLESEVRSEVPLGGIDLGLVVSSWRDDRPRRDDDEVGFGERPQRADAAA